VARDPPLMVARCSRGRDRQVRSCAGPGGALPSRPSGSSIR
jgi:hypothetical protein